MNRHAIRTAKEPSSKILRRLHHTILTLRAEHRQLTRSSEVIQQMPIQLPVRNTQHELLAASKRRQQLGTQLVRPVAQERQLAREGQITRLGRISHFLSERARAGPAGGIPRAVAVQQEQLRDLTSLWSERAGVGEAVVCRAERVPWREVAPVPRYVELGLRGGTVGLRSNEREDSRLKLIVGVRGGCLDGIGLGTGRCWPRKAHDRLRRKERGVDCGCG